MNLLNQKILKRRIENFEFPKAEDQVKIDKALNGWILALKEHDLSKTKELSVQGMFLVKFFGEVLGYSVQVDSENEWNLIQHPSNDVDTQEPDGSLGFYSTSLKHTDVVIELKDAMTSLDKKQIGREKGYTPIEQGYLYATKFDNCNWIIVSNFKEIRLYSKYKTQNYCEKFMLMDLVNKDEFKRFYYIFCKNNLISKTQSEIDFILKESVGQEESISRKFYEEYKKVRQSTFNLLVANNLEISKELLFEKTQKILDRMIFILFCEDTPNLLPKNIAQETYELGIRSRDRSNQKVWREFKNLFQDIDEGRVDLNPPINKYNGGLFAKDEDLDNLSIPDGMWANIISLNKYDFQSDLNVNILGHIFEQSINDIEDLKQELVNGSAVGNESTVVSKRKKEGIYYTPEYITKYIVENTVGKFIDNNQKKLDTITVLDPACGSGAFLNQAHSFLLNLYYVKFQEKIEREKKQQLDLSDVNYADVNKGILLNNLYGVDLNQESVEITKLALWLKTAKSSEPLSNLDENVKCGNSIVESKSVSDRAFDWSRSFKKIFDSNGGFDVIVGNPPYGYRGIPSSNLKSYYLNQYVTHEGNYEFYRFFIEKSMKLLSDGGYLGFIVPNTFLTANSFSKLRKFMLQFQIVQIVDLGLDVFSDVLVESVILILKKEKPTSLTNVTIDRNHFGEIIPESEYFIDQNIWLNNKKYIFTIYLNDKNQALISKMESNGSELINFCDFCTVGINTGYIKSEMVSATKKDIRYHKLLNGKDIGRYQMEWKGEWIIYDKEFVEKYGEKGRTLPVEEIFSREKILVQRTRRGLLRKLIAYLDIEKYYNLNRISNIVIKPTYNSYYFLALINSKLLDYYFNKKYAEYEVKPSHLASLPIIYKKGNKLEVNAKFIQDLLKKKDVILRESLRFLKDEFVNSKILNTGAPIFYRGWNELSEKLDNEFKELDLSKKEKIHSWFIDKQKLISEIDCEVERIELEIDKEIYSIYGLTQTEIEMVESYYK